MQLVIINEGVFSTCRGCDRQSHHPHTSIQLKVRRNLGLVCRLQNRPGHHPPFQILYFAFGSSTIQLGILLVERFLWHMLHLRLEKDHVVSLKRQNEIFRVPDFSPTHELMDTWNEGRMNEWNPHLYKSVRSPSADLCLWSLHSSLNLTAFKRSCGFGGGEKSPDRERGCRRCTESS